MSRLDEHDGPAVAVPMAKITAHRQLIRWTLIQCKIPPQELRDLEQTVYLGAFRAMRAGRFRPGLLPLAMAIPRWLVGISWRSAVRYHESPQRREIPSGLVVVEGRHPEARLEARDALRLLSRLPVNHRAALVAVGLGARACEIAGWMAVSRRVVAVWLCEGREELVKRLAIRSEPRGAVRRSRRRRGG
ncbi:MAG: hypothetical protein IT372_38155 [Polyangiaceae bacterium]|nr:hypothetical protein [Polyangiaceae bacterium]